MSSSPIPLKAERDSMVWTHRTLLMRSSIDGRLGCFHLQTIVTKAAINLCRQIPVQVSASSSLGVDPEARLLDHVAIPSHCLREDRPVCPKAYPHQLYTKVLYLLLNICCFLL